ncbi:thiopeptide-type bacteriocin biosynthesis protein [Streptomyces sudanensis]|uniref:thiopeptide-type bacteriocin biosynthesis protein n=1 Tax=Streptomyces sudanensis TaxID=436397 RepID=UPI0020CFC39F|nr:thiopeptide-type bacteriocin biosynthesis protein [Streptomyces sudanensis]MCP9989181.1 thiopeptide-type bacteriocin biosynthesis protein [Streptomyces sudanensis]
MTTTDTWHSHHLFLHCGTEDTDAFLTRWLAPRLDGLVASGQASRWFFIRYGEDGPHLRVRVRGLSPEAAAELPGALARAAAEHPAVAGGSWPSRHGEVRAVEYVPETGRYGGPRALPTAEEVFAVSSRVAVEALRTLPAGSGGAARLAIAADLAHATAYALGMDRLAAARWLRRHASGWRWVTEVALLPGAAVHTRVHTVYASQRTALRQRARLLREALRGGGGEPWLSEWVRCVREADGRLRAGAGAEASGAVPPWVWASQLHMLFNRLGVAPDEERAVCLLAARTLLDTDDAPSFFPEGHRAADVQYLERSRFRIGLGEDSPLRPLPPSALPAGVAAAPAPPEVPLPAGPLPEVPLGAALRGRTSLRGALRGPLDAGGSARCCGTPSRTAALRSSASPTAPRARWTTAPTRARAPSTRPGCACSPSTWRASRRPRTTACPSAGPCGPWARCRPPRTSHRCRRTSPARRTTPTGSASTRRRSCWASTWTWGCCAAGTGCAPCGWRCWRPAT